jgi:lipopolysaccharide export system permease protein
MKILSKYISIEILKTSTGALLFFVFILLSGNTIRDMLDLIANGKLSILPAFCLILALLPAMISYAMPLGLLTGIFIVIGKMSSSGEIIAIKSAGIGVKKIIQPILLISLACTLFAAVVNFYYGPNSIELYKRGLRNVVKTNPMKFITPSRFIDDFPGYLIYCDEMRHDKFYNFHIWEMNDNKKVISYGRAKSGTLSYDENSDSLVLRLENGNMEKRPELSPEAFYDRPMPMISYGELSINLSLEDIFGRTDWQSGKVSHMNLTKLLKAKKQADLDGDKTRSALIWLQLQKNLAMACGVFILAALAIPLAFMARRYDNFLYFTLALTLSLGYYFLMSLLSSIHHLHLAHWCIWLPNMALAFIAGLLFRLMLRH